MSVGAATIARPGLLLIPNYRFLYRLTVSSFLGAVVYLCVSGNPCQLCLDYRLERHGSVSCTFAENGAELKKQGAHTSCESTGALLFHSPSVCSLS